MMLRVNQSDRERERERNNHAVMTAAGPASWLPCCTFIERRCEPSCQEWVLMPTSWQYSLSRMARHSLPPLIESQRTHSAIKDQSEARYLPLISARLSHSIPFTQWMGVISGSSPYSGKSLDWFMRTNSTCFVLIFHRFFSHFGMKDESREGGRERTRRGKLWKTLLITSRSNRQVLSSDDEVAT